MLTVLYYIILGTPIILLIIWVALLGASYNANPAAAVFFIGVFIIILFLPSQSKFFYLKCIGLLASYLIAEFLLVGLNWNY